MRSYIRSVAAVLFATALTGTATLAAAQNKTQVQWLGQASTKITTPGGKVIVIDPWLTSNPKTPAAYKNLEALGKVDLILVTHGHFDHMADAPALAKLNKAPIYGPAGLMQTFAALGLVPAAQAVRFGKGGTVTPLGDKIKITQTHAEHSSEVAHKNPATGKDEVHVGGEPAGFIIELEDGFKIYHMGDTGLFGDMNLIGSYYKPDLVLIPIGGHFVMSPKDAAVATRDMIKPKFAIPIHYGTIPVLKGTPAEYTAALGSTSTKVFVLEPGQAVEF
ncbi:metal-dependent hydrolase [Lacisediminimonas profundi]|uniref:metal-dependent hydrolase n=1 Tax=Lacisediminimonas profundi TaxID=2603856 RepID=UPI00124B4093|nr:metal-dependent hydrolase [Lacisediminimonas profundi]